MRHRSGRKASGISQMTEADTAPQLHCQTRDRTRHAQQWIRRQLPLRVGNQHDRSWPSATVGLPMMRSAGRTWHGATKTTDRIRAILPMLRRLLRPRRADARGTRALRSNRRGAEPARGAAPGVAGVGWTCGNADVRRAMPRAVCRHVERLPLLGGRRPRARRHDLAGMTSRRNGHPCSVRRPGNRPSAGARGSATDDGQHPGARPGVATRSAPACRAGGARSCRPAA